MSYGYGDIPDDFPSKSLVPLGEHLWNVVKELGHEYWMDKFTDESLDLVNSGSDFMYEKFKLAVDSARRVMSGEIKDPENVLTTWFFPPVLYVRADLQMGSTKMIYGDSTDITFIVLNDASYEIDMLINGHMEDGVPVDYWFLYSDDDAFDRKHLKRGMKLREIPKRTKHFTKSGIYALDILKDIRNERSPQWADSQYSLCMVWFSAAVNLFAEPSSWSSLGAIWDGINAQKIYGRPIEYFCYVPWPPIMSVLTSMGRPEWMMKLAGLLTGHKLFVNGFEPVMQEWIQRQVPEFWDFLNKNWKERGVTTPRQSLGVKPPDLKNKKKFQKEEFDWVYPNGTRIKPFEWDLPEQDVFSGIFTDITHKTPSEDFYGKEHVISTGIGGV